MSITLDIENNAFLKEIFQEGESAMLRRLLERRFGALPEWAESKIAGANTESLERWGLQLLDAQNLEDALK